MGALIAGISISTFPYNLDVVAKVVSIRDFFVTLFFVALGMQIPMPTADVLGLALLASAFLMLSRMVVVFPDPALAAAWPPGEPASGDQSRADERVLDGDRGNRDSATTTSIRRPSAC